MLKTFSKIESLYIKGWITKEGYNVLTYAHLQKIYKLFLKGLISSKQFEEILKKYL